MPAYLDEKRRRIGQFYVNAASFHTNHRFERGQRIE